ncbi:lysophospholipid acyltransferase family protein [Actinomyces howellii]|uniref:1-acyl-sn-glycerol-3-phosphate acyltransferase n=1 Tax=Actinomyces howellii TaxID=52771 RepID=A0A3S4UVF8_9ACTO|nr:lysophospholipid acyltransferase family protein [Actinomyces howellii]VEG25555.1 1-acyl-sn-glycerol-3-phosphate acyltransferase [Actinomyces howellii]
MTPFYRFASRGAIIPFLKAVSRQHVTGTENIPPSGGFVAVANHLSDLDSLTAMRALVDVDVPAYSLAKSSLFEIPLLGRVFKAGGQIPVYRDTAQAGNALVEAERRLRAGDVVMVFPEGTLSRDPLQWPMTGKTGAARLAMATGVPVLPMGQWGAQDIIDSFGGGFHPFPRKDVRVVIGEPLDLSRFGSDTTDRDAVREATAEIMRAITALVEQLRGLKAPRPYDMRYDGDPGKGKRGVRRPDPAPGAQDGGTA